MYIPPPDGNLNLLTLPKGCGRCHKCLQTYSLPSKNRHKSKFYKSLWMSFSHITGEKHMGKKLRKYRLITWRSSLVSSQYNISRKSHYFRDWQSDRLLP